MHSFLIDMCGSCLTTNVDLKEYMIVEDKEMRCFDTVKMIFPNTEVPVYFECGYSLCEVCIKFLKGAVIFRRRLSKSHNAYSKYMQTLNYSNRYKVSISISQHINKGHLPILETAKGTVRKQTEYTCNQMATNTNFEDEELYCDTYKDFYKYPGELDAKIVKKENILLNTFQKVCKNMDNIITDSIKKEVLRAGTDSCNQTDFIVTENMLCVMNIKEEHVQASPMSDNNNCCQMESKIEVKEEDVAPWESARTGHDNIEPIYVCEERYKNEILANNLTSTDIKLEKTTSTNFEGKISPILLTKCKVGHKRKRPYKCEVCEKSFTRNDHLITHKRFHTGERPHKCDVCGKSFTIKQHLTIHKRIHTGERPHKCDVCGKSFTIKQHLTIHKRIHTGERPYKCDVCEKSFPRNDCLIAHKRFHTGERPHKCDVCGKSFTIKQHLTIHKRIHTGERPYKCDVCEKSFTRNDCLIAHKRIHTGERPHKCDVCGKSFTLKQHLTIHKRIPYGRTTL